MKLVFIIAIATAILSNPVMAKDSVFPKFWKCYEQYSDGNRWDEDRQKCITPTKNRLGVSAERLAANEKPEPGTTLSKFRWCQKRFDYGWKWDKEAKKCIAPAKSRVKK